MRTHSASGTRRSAFTLVELLVVIGIIGVLAAILFPVIGKVREAARETDTRAFITSLEAACQAYKQDHNGYPGPLPSNYITAQDQKTFGYIPANFDPGDTGIRDKAAPGAGFNDANVSSAGLVAAGERVTQAENMVLGLLGGITVNRTAGAGSFYLEFDAAAVGTGPVGLNPTRPTKGTPYMQVASLSEGKFRQSDSPAPADDAANPSKDSRIPEFVDRWTEPLPILVFRARTGGRAFSGTAPTAYADNNNNVVVNVPFDSANPSGAAQNGQYNLVDVTPYTQSSIGTGRKVKQADYVPSYDANLPHGLHTVDVTKGLNKGAGAEYVYPYDAFSYLGDPATYTMSDPAATKKGKMRARKQDAIILISAGRDRVYGTADDITNFGSVLP